MKCPNDKTDMEKGHMDGYWWKNGEIPSLVTIGRKDHPNGGNSYWIMAYRCPQCGKIEVYTIDRK